MYAVLKTFDKLLKEMAWTVYYSMRVWHVHIEIKWPADTTCFLLKRSIPILATFILCATFALESERDAIFIASSDASPGLLILLILLPLLVLFITLISVPQFTFIFFPFRLEPLKVSHTFKKVTWFRWIDLFILFHFLVVNEHHGGVLLGGEF